MNDITTRTAVLVSSLTIPLLWLSMPGGGTFWPLLAVACVPFLIIVCKGSRKQIVLCGMFVGTGHFLVQLYWIVFVLGQYGDLPLFVSVPALVLLSVYMACYMVAFGLLANRCIQSFSPSVCLWILPGLWVGLDWLRSVPESGFPWMDLGYGVALVPLLFQSADIWGHFGLTFLILLINTFFTLLIVNSNGKKEIIRLAVPLSVVFLTTAGYSGWRWQKVEQSLQDAEVITIAIVQGNIDQGQKWNPERRGSTVKSYVDQSRKIMHKPLRPELLVWPETSLPFYPVNHPLLLPIHRLLDEEQVMLLTGAPWYERETPDSKEILFYNSSLLFNSKGNIVARTSKSHLVPFGEYIPFERFIPFVAPLVEAVGNFSRGEIADPPSCKNARIGVLICFESIFGNISRKWVDTGANLLVNMTNDAWYGKSSAPHQTLGMTRLRAVETRRSIVRSANTGFSGFIDPMGRVYQVSPLFVSWEATRQVQLMEGRTLFVRGGYLFAPLCFMLTFLYGIIAFRKQRRIIK
ncbi:MAG: apolipoprotein N-acyltransferase [Desulfocapsa sp.]|uniref:Apolipoprotein N-acyltransferase n=1 Tax=Desulfotalea psychrophila TaxID=84980 RepID=A0ABS3ASH5_9BACT|nr:apolipoprotein N-acyltransferase [Desulfocapsa sp.]MBN4068064.1 apolipoprotein N-acyltransferase [Desulfotalea psychrophila]